MTAHIINSIIEIEQHSVKWIHNLMKAQSAVADDSFQRRYVWLEKHQAKLIETILLGFPVPEIYLWEESTNADSGDTKYSIIDGQQRLGALENFISNNLVLEPKYLDEESRKWDFCGKRFSELSTDYKSALWSFKLSFRIVSRKVSKSDIVAMFLRLNSSNMTLTPQELRNAEYDGEFLKLSVKLSENKLFETYELFSKQDIRRMRDVEFVSSILMFLRLGIKEDTTQSYINRAYDLYNERYDEKLEDEKTFNQILAIIGVIVNSDKAVINFLRKPTHLYILFIACYSGLPGLSSTAKKCISPYKQFVEAQNNNEDVIKAYTPTEIEMIEEYRKLSSAGTGKKQNRLARTRILQHFLAI